MQTAANNDGEYTGDDKIECWKNWWFPQPNWERGHLLLIPLRWLSSVVKGTKLRCAFESCQSIFLGVSVAVGRFPEKTGCGSVNLLRETHPDLEGCHSRRWMPWQGEMGPMSYIQEQVNFHLCSPFSSGHVFFLLSPVASKLWIPQPVSTLAPGVLRFFLYAGLRQEMHCYLFFLKRETI